jgi:ATP-dependent RNA helicase RhlE
MFNDTNKGSGFQNLGIAPKLLEILYNLKFTQPTPIQQQSIPAAIEGKDIMGIAQTGTGKTLAFGIPMIQRLAQNKGKFKGLVILPTRELAVQVNETLKKVGMSIGLKTAVLIGGEQMGRQIRSLHGNVHIIIATPGRLIDHLERKTVNLQNIGILVLDEADRMLDMGFAPQIKRIMQQVPKSRQTMLFSATMPDTIVQIAKTFMTLPLRIEVAPQGTTTELVTHEVFFVHRENKSALLKTILADYKGSILVFCRTKFGAKKVAKVVRDFGHTSTEIHSNRSLSQRLAALEGFKIGRFRILVATDIAARGIDVKGIQVVLNYDLPATAEDYVHRIGRTGRAGKDGHTISFATPDQRSDIRSIERLIRINLPISKTPELKGSDQIRTYHSQSNTSSQHDHQRHSPTVHLPDSDGDAYRYEPKHFHKGRRSNFRRNPHQNNRSNFKPRGRY